MNEVDIFGQIGFELRIVLTDKELGAQNSTINLPDDSTQIGFVAVLGKKYSLPVPLIDIKAVKVVKLLVSTNGIHVSHDAKTWLRLVLGERQTFPLS